jgi:hypothetical protein
VNNIVSVFSAFYGTAAAKYGYVRANPVQLVEMPSEPVRFQQGIAERRRIAGTSKRIGGAVPNDGLARLCATEVRLSELLGLLGNRSTGNISACGLEKRCTMAKSIRQRRTEAAAPSGSREPSLRSSSSFKR